MVILCVREKAQNVSFNMVDHRQCVEKQLQKEYNIYSCFRVALLVLKCHKTKYTTSSARI